MNGYWSNRLVLQETCILLEHNAVLPWQQSLWTMCPLGHSTCLILGSHSTPRCGISWRGLFFYSIHANDWGIPDQVQNDGGSDGEGRLNSQQFNEKSSRRMRREHLTPIKSAHPRIKIPKSKITPNSKCQTLAISHWRLARSFAHHHPFFSSTNLLIN